MTKLRLILMLFILPVCALAQGAQYTGIAQTARNMIGMGNVYVPIPGASVNVCTGVYAGTACPSGGNVTVYSNQALTTALTQPITADNYGNFTFWAAPGAYYFTVTGQGAASSSYQLTLPFGISGTYNAVAKSIEQVRYADQFTSLQAAITDACAATPVGSVFIPPGTYAAPAGGFMLCSGLKLIGAGYNAVTITTAQASAVVFPLIDMAGVTLQGFTLTGSGAGATAIKCGFCQYSRVSEVHVSGPFLYDLDLTNDANGSTIYNVFEDDLFSGYTGAGTYIQSPTVGKTTNANTFVRVNNGPSAPAGSPSAILFDPAVGPYNPGPPPSYAPLGEMGENIWLNGEASNGGNYGVGINAQSDTIRNATFIGITVESNATGVLFNTNNTTSGGAGPDSVHIIGSVIDSNNTNVTNTKSVRTVLDTFVSGQFSSYSLTQQGDATFDGLGIGGTSAASNEINAANNFTVAISGVSKMQFGSSQVAMSVPFAMGGNNITGINSIVSNSANPAVAGYTIRLASGDAMAWRNAANTADIPFGKDGSDNLDWNGVPLVTTTGTQTLTNKTISGGTVNATTLQQGGVNAALTSQLPLSGSVAGSTTSLAANTCGDVVTQTVTGATTTMTPVVTVDGALPTSGLVIQSAVTAANTVSIEYCNVTTGSVIPAAATLEIRVIQ